MAVTRCFCSVDVAFKHGFLQFDLGIILPAAKMASLSSAPGPSLSRPLGHLANGDALKSKRSRDGKLGKPLSDRDADIGGVRV